jgi:hypothetical protein
MTLTDARRELARLHSEVIALKRRNDQLEADNKRKRHEIEVGALRLEEATGQANHVRSFWEYRYAQTLRNLHDTQEALNAQDE